MTKLTLQYPPGATPLDPNETGGLIPDFITLQSELNELEHENIQSAMLWLQKTRSAAPLDPLDIGWIQELHKQMFGRVWRWAGQFRKTDKNLGVPWTQVPIQTQQLLRNTQHWVEHHTFPWDEIAARFHHRLVQIHLFPNGNGRHARLMTDLLLEFHGKTRFSWGAAKSTTAMEVESDRRHEYLSALKDADRGDFSALLKFVRS